MVTIVYEEMSPFLPYVSAGKSSNGKMGKLLNILMRLLKGYS
jgi:hypothetical protein